MMWPRCSDLRFTSAAQVHSYCLTFFWYLSDFSCWIAFAELFPREKRAMTTCIMRLLKQDLMWRYLNYWIHALWDRFINACAKLYHFLEIVSVEWFINPLTFVQHCSSISPRYPFVGYWIPEIWRYLNFRTYNPNRSRFWFPLFQGRATFMAILRCS